MPRGLDFMDNHVYIADFTGSAVSAFDTSTGAFTVMRGVSASAPISFAQPGAVKVGPDGNLYVLNNGPGDQALLVVRPDGSLVRGLNLSGKSPVAVGLSLDAGGSIYVGDMTGGHILKYGPNGGDPLAQYGGKVGGFNNVAGVAVADDGKIYAAEQSNLLVQELDPDGKYVRSFDLGCPPFYMALKGDWLDVGCTGKGLLSINRITGQVQRSTVAGDGQQLTDPVGMAYGTFDILYVMENNTLIAYKVEH
jgi:DNA-binding beta-propeller fold protein YncE